MSDQTELSIEWSYRRLRSNRQPREFLCPHEIQRPRVLAPLLVRPDSSVLWRPAPEIRECCINRGEGLALAAWWWEVDNRFEDVRSGNFPEDGVWNLRDAILSQRSSIEALLALHVPRVSEDDIQRYVWYREDIGLTTRDLPIEPAGLKVLGLSWPCTKQEVINRWNVLALQAHPDHGGNIGTFQRYLQAYQALRRHFDQESA